MVTQQAAIATAKAFVQDILATGFRLKKAILFGSFVRNEQLKWSDIDIALVADEFLGVASIDISHFLSVKISTRKYTPIEPHTFPTDYFEQGDPFIDEIKRTGIELPLQETTTIKNSSPQAAGKSGSAPAA